MTEREDLERQIGSIRSQGALGRSALVNRLFDYLAESSLAGRSPKESEVAVEVFHRRPDFDPTQDAIARVYVHKLRKKLEDLANSGHGRLSIPRGEYRLVLADASAPEPDRNVRRSGRAKPIALAAAFALVAVLASALTWGVLSGHPRAAVRGGGLMPDQVWSPLLSNGFPTLVVVGDYYIFGEIGDGGAPDRLVREYTINSRTDLDRFVMKNPARGAFYSDLGLTYAPVGGAYALLNVATVLSPGKRVRLITASQLTPPMLKENNIVYVGYLSGLGLLREATFGGSRFAIGATYDDLIDKTAHRRYFSQGGGPRRDGAMYRDFGYFSTFAGPQGNRFVIIAGTRDAGLMQMAETATSAAGLKAITKQAGHVRSLEALYLIDGIDRFNVAGRLVVSSPLDEAAIWNREATKTEVFPAG